jgi:protein-tyrosine phosphatase
MGYVDIHCHLLWGLDDGCRTAEESLAAARTLVALGYSEVAPSPHTRAEFAGVDAALCRARLIELEALLRSEGVELRLHAGAENFFDDAFMERASRGEARGLGERGSNVLVELPFQGRVPALADLVFRLKVKGLTPVFAHPERCAEFEQVGRAEEVVRLGGALQLDMGALVGRYGRTARKVAERMLGAELYAIAATDLHGAAGAQEWIGEAMRALEKKVGASGVERLCAANPRRAIAGEELA